MNIVHMKKDFVDRCVSHVRERRRLFFESVLQAFENLVSDSAVMGVIEQDVAHSDSLLRDVRFHCSVVMVMNCEVSHRF